MDFAAALWAALSLAAPVAVESEAAERAARLRLELSQRRAHPFPSVEDEKEFLSGRERNCAAAFRSREIPGEEFPILGALPERTSRLLQVRRPRELRRSPFPRAREETLKLAAARLSFQIFHSLPTRQSETAFRPAERRYRALDRAARSSDQIVRALSRMATQSVCCRST